MLTALVVSGIALLNVLLPAWIKQHAPRRSVVLMSCYSGFLGLSGAVAPLSVLWFSGSEAWRPALGIWATLAVSQAIVWTLVLIRVGVDKPAKPAAEKYADTASTSSVSRADAEVGCDMIAETSLW